VGRLSVIPVYRTRIGDNGNWFSSDASNSYTPNKTNGAVRQMRTRIGLLAQPESMRSIIDATQREQRFDWLKVRA